MGLEVQILETDTYLSITAAGEYSRVYLLDLFDRVKVESEARAGSKVILDITEVTGTIPIMDMHGLGEHCSKSWKQPFKVAIVSPANGLNKFFENVARNRGVQLAVVPDHARAIDWLK